jgi:hypothetical protein
MEDRTEPVLADRRPAPPVAAAAPDGITAAALIAVFAGWFLCSTLTASIGSLQRGVRFFEMSAIIADPTRLFFAFDAPMHRILFGLACVLCLAAPLIPWLRPSRAAVVGLFTPLLLMIACGVLLYVRTSGDFFEVPHDPATLTGTVLRFANGIVQRGSALVSRHISLGVGGYLALAGALVLAERGWRRLR